MHVLVIGAGIIGVTAAHALLDEGCEVTIIEREGPAAGTSQGNAGWIAFGDVVPLASPNTIRRVPGYLADPLGPLTFRPSYLPFMLPWFARFLWASRPTAVERSTVALLELQGRAMSAWDELAGRIGIGNLIHRRGALYVYDEEGTFAEGQATLERRRRAGIDLDVIEPDELRQMEPNLRDGLVGAIYHAGATHVADPRAITRAMFDAAIARGAAFVRGEVGTISPAATGAIAALEGGRSFEAGAVVLSSGVWSKRIAATIGDRVSLESERGYNVSFPGITSYISRPVNVVGRGFVVSPLDSGLRIGGAVEFAGLEALPNHARTRAIHQKAQSYFRDLPAFETGQAWMGHRPSTPDSLPVIGASKATPAVIYAFGHGHYGLTQAAITAKLVADLVFRRQSAMDLSPFAATRFG